MIAPPQRDPIRFPSFDCIAFHDGCPDGVMAATVAMVALESKPTALLPCRYDAPLPERLTTPNPGKLLCVDWSPNQQQLRLLLETWSDVFVIDHHASRDWLPRLFPDNCVFDQGYSGAMLTHYWFHGCDPNPPMVLQYVQDRDLWKWELPHSREVSQAIWNNLGFAFLETLLIDFPLESLVRIGSQLLQQQDAEIQRLAALAFPVRIHGEYVALANAPIHPSEVCHELLYRWPWVENAAVFSFQDSSRVRLSFRSRTGKAQRLAEAYGGGGHANSAGAHITTKELVKILGRAVDPEALKP